MSLDHLERIFDHLGRNRIRMYRMSSNLAPYETHPDLPRFHGQVARCADRLGALGERARAMDLRLSTHPGQYTVLMVLENDDRVFSLRMVEPIALRIGIPVAWDVHHHCHDPDGIAHPEAPRREGTSRWRSVRVEVLAAGRPRRRRECPAPGPVGGGRSAGVVPHRRRSAVSGLRRVCAPAPARADRSAAGLRWRGLPRDLRAAGFLAASGSLSGQRGHAALLAKP